MSPKDVNDAGGARWEDSVPLEPYVPDNCEEHPESAGMPPEPPEPPDMPGPPAPAPEYGWPPPDSTSHSAPTGAAAAAPGSGIKEKITPILADLIARNNRVRNLWEGRGMPWMVSGEGGEKKRLPATSAGYALSLICELVKRGERNQSVLATALWCRPDDSAKIRGEEYILRIIKKAFEIISDMDDSEPADIDFKVENFKIYDSDPSTYKLVVDGVGIRLSVDELVHPGKFASRFLQRMRRVPSIPRKPRAWEDVINVWLADAEVVEMPPEASTDTMTREIIQDIIEKMPTGDKLSDLDLGKAVYMDGHQALKTRPLLKAYCESEDRISTNVICRHLRAMGFESQTKRVGNNVERVWIRPDDPDADAGTDGDSDSIDDCTEPGSDG